MNIAFFAVPDLLAPLHLLVRRLMKPAPVAARVPAHAGALPARLVASAQPIVVPQQRPLRVVHVMERGASRAHAGRMVISGRMADVCAELDRLAAREATLH